MQGLCHNHAEATVRIITKINLEEDQIGGALAHCVKRSYIVAANKCLYITLFDTIAAHLGVRRIHCCAVAGHGYTGTVQASKSTVTCQLVATFDIANDKSEWYI